MIGLRQNDDLRDLKPRLQTIVAFVLLLGALLTGRLCQLQVLEADHYARRAERNFVSKVDVEAPRGRIFDVNGVPLATNRSSYTLYVTGWTRYRLDPDEGIVRTEESKRVAMGLRERDQLMAQIDFVDAEDRDDFLTLVEGLRADETKGRYAQIARRNLSWDEYARIVSRLDALDPWVEIRESSRRLYPQGGLTAFVTGQMGSVSARTLEKSPHLGYRLGDRVGRTGIERQWENYLRGRLGARWRVVDARRRESSKAPPWAVEALPPARDPIPGQDIYLTLDLDLQRVAVEALSNKLAGAVVAMEVTTGRVLAMVSVPSIDPNMYEQPIPLSVWNQWSQSPLKPFIDKTVQEHFFPGSTYKVISALVALSDPEFDPDETIDCTGYVKFGGRKFRDTHVHEAMNLEQAIVHSCNSYFYELAIRNTLSLERVEPVARALGLGERTGLGINFEVKGTIPTQEFEAREGTYQGGVRLNSAIGQGNVKVTVMQLAVLYAAVANGGYVMTPYLVDRIETNDKKVVLTHGPQRKNDVPIIDPADRERIHRGLVGVVNSAAGTAYSERLDNIKVAGKTGTAQVGREAQLKTSVDVEGWDTTKDHAWFAGYAPADNPKIVVAALVVHGGIGADAAAPIVMKLIEHYLGDTSQDGVRPRAYGVPPPLPGKRAGEPRP